MEDLDESKIDTSFKLAEGVIQKTPVDEKTEANEHILAEELLADFLGGLKLEKTPLSVEEAKPLFYLHLMNAFTAFSQSHCLVLDIVSQSNVFKPIIFCEGSTIKFISSTGEPKYKFTVDSTCTITGTYPPNFDPNSFFTNCELWNGQICLPGVKGKNVEIVYRNHFHNPNINSIQGCEADLVKKLIQERRVTPPAYDIMISQGLFDLDMITYVDGLLGNGEIKKYYTENSTYLIELQGAKLNYEGELAQKYFTKELVAGFFNLKDNGRPQIKDLFVGDENRLKMLHKKIALVGVGTFMNLWCSKNDTRREVIGAIQYPSTYTELDFTTLVEDLFKEIKE